MSTSLLLSMVFGAVAGPEELSIPADAWVKLSPLEGTPVSARLGYEGACAWDSRHRVLIRYGGHNQGGGGEQHSEVWTFEPVTARWTLKEPNVSPPGVCCAQQNVFDPVQGRYLRFSAFSGSHGWQWWREIYLNDASVWSYDLSENVWRNLSPLPAAMPRGLRCASWDSHCEVVVVFGGENSQEGTLVYDPYTNAWTRLSPSPQPEFRSGGNMAYDEARRLHILFGAQFSDDRHTWAYDLARNEWRDMKPEAMPPTDQNDAVLTYDPFRKAIIAIVKITEGKEEAAKHRLETWTYDAGANRWSRIASGREPDPTGNRARVLSFAPELNAAILENRTHSPHGPDEQQIWALRLQGAGPEPASAPEQLSVSTMKTSARLAWKAGPPSPSAPARYLIYRGEGEKPWRVDYRKIAEVDSSRHAFEDTGLNPGTLYFYEVRSAGKEGEPGPGARARAQPRIVEDAVVSVLSAREVEISWKPPPGTDIAGYLVERASVGMLTEDQLKRLKTRTPPLAEPSAGAVEWIGRFQRLTPSPLKETRFTDAAVDLSRPEAPPSERIYDRKLHEEHLDKAGKPYRFAVFAYRVIAMNELGVESGPSPAFLTLPSPPQHLFSKEEGTACRLRWAANPEKGIRGYRVYRMDGRYDNEKISRLTSACLPALEHCDREAGKNTRRYYLVAVDSLGQEGFPSSPVWFDREWKKYYVPFVGEWHQ